MSISTDVRTNQQVSFPVAHLFMQEAIWLGTGISLKYSLESLDFYTQYPSIDVVIRALERMNQRQLPERAQSRVESPENLQRWYDSGLEMVDYALEHIDLSIDYSLEWIESYCSEWYDAIAESLGEHCTTTARAFYDGMTDAMLELL